MNFLGTFIFDSFENSFLEVPMRAPGHPVLRDAEIREIDTYKPYSIQFCNLGSRLLLAVLLG